MRTEKPIKETLTEVKFGQEQEDHGQFSQRSAKISCRREPLVDPRSSVNDFEIDEHIQRVERYTPDR